MENTNMNNYDIHKFNRDMQTLAIIIDRVKAYISPDKLIYLLMNKEEKTPINTVRSNGNLTLSDKIRTAIKAYRTATTDEIYSFFSKQHWEINNKVKSSIRSILASLKQRKKIEGNAKEGFRLVESKEDDSLGFL